jgi:hypothetical protein
MAHIPSPSPSPPPIDWSIEMAFLDYEDDLLLQDNVPRTTEELYSMHGFSSSLSVAFEVKRRNEATSHNMHPEDALSCIDDPAPSTPVAMSMCKSGLVPMAPVS